MNKNGGGIGLKVAFILCLIGAISAVSYYLFYPTHDEITYTEFKVKRDSITMTILTTGTVQPQNRLDIKPPVAGRVDEILVKEGDKVKKGQLLAWMSSTERAALLDAARAQGPAEVAKWEDLYKPTPIIAPIDGTIIQRNVESGQTFSNDVPVLVMADRLTVKAQVDETDIAQIQNGQRVMIVLDAYSDKQVPSKVDKIAYDARTVNNVTTYIVDVLPDQQPPYMRSGMTANVSFILSTKENILTVTNQALRIQNAGTTVLVKAGGQPEERVIEVGATNGRVTEVLSGLNEGDTVLIQQIKYNRTRGSSPFSPFGKGR